MVVELQTLCSPKSRLILCVAGINKAIHMRNKDKATYTLPLRINHREEDINSPQATPNFPPATADTKAEPTAKAEPAMETVTNMK